MGIIKLSNVNFSYPSKNDFHLKNISFECEENKLIGLAGPNGSGKSTLLKLISGIEKPISGEITLKGKPINSYNSIERAKIMRWVGQSEESKVQFKVFDYLLFGSFPKISFFGKITKREEKKAEELLETFYLIKKKYWEVENLSGGEKKLLQIAFSLISEPEVLILDEPFAHLDPVHLKALFSVIKNEKEKGRCYIISSHEYNTLKYISDYLILLSEGEILTFNEPSKIKKELWEKTFKISFIEEKLNINNLIPDIYQEFNK